MILACANLSKLMLRLLRQEILASGSRPLCEDIIDLTLDHWLTHPSSLSALLLREAFGNR